MEVLHVVQLNQTPILQQLRWEEALLRADRRNWCLLNRGSPPAIVMGISSKFSELVHQERLREAPLPVIRRFSGGGTVVVDEDTLFITFICNTSFVPVLPYPEHIMRWTEDFYQPLFYPHSFCLRENDYVIGDKKFGGNAQSICKQRWLHHSSFLWNYSLSHMNYLCLPSKMPSYRQRRTHKDFLCCLSDYWSCPKQFQEGIVQHLGQRFSLQFCDQVELEKIVQLPHRQSTTLVT